MPSLRQLNSRIKTVQTTTKLTKAMQAVAAMRLRKLTKQAEITKGYRNDLEVVFHSLCKSLKISNGQNLYFDTDTTKPVLVVIISPTRGFCGGLHRTVVTETYKTLIQRGFDPLNRDKVTFLTVHRPAQKMISKLGGNILASFSKNYKEVNAQALLPIAELINQAWISGDFSEVILSFAESSHTLKAVISTEQLLPFLQISDENSVSSGVQVNLPKEITNLISEFAPQWIEMKIHHAMIQTRTSEEGARMIAMNQATDNATRLTDKLKLAYFRLRQAKITQEISEIVGGSL
jgi:F-type H+-transporting ATPase subunit gamma